jgi:DNA-binding transcriptional ArsR family regulator
LRPDRNISDPQLAKALAHPLRVAILAVLEERTASPSEIATELDASLGLVSYHVRTLARYGLVKLVDTRPRRGALEHYYRAEERPVLTSEAWEKVPSIVKQATVRATLAQLSGHVNDAALTGGFERSSAHLSRSPMVLDKLGWEELAIRFDRLLADCEQIAAASAERLAAADHTEELRAMAVLMLFEAAPEAAGKPSAPTRARRTTRQSRPSTASR